MILLIKIVMIIVYADIIVIIGGLINGVIALILGAGPTAYTSLGTAIRSRFTCIWNW